MPLISPTSKDLIIVNRLFNSAWAKGNVIAFYSFDYGTIPILSNFLSGHLALCYSQGTNDWNSELARCKTISLWGRNGIGFFTLPSDSSVLFTLLFAPSDAAIGKTYSMDLYQAS